MGTQQKNATSSPSSFVSRFCFSALRAKTLNSSSYRTTSGDGLIRRLGVFDLLLLGVGASIGAGIFVVTGTVARDAGPGSCPFSPFFFWFPDFISEFNFCAISILLQG